MNHIRLIRFKNFPDRLLDVRINARVLLVAVVQLTLLLRVAFILKLIFQPDPGFQLAVTESNLVP